MNGVVMLRRECAVNLCSPSQKYQFLYRECFFSLEICDFPGTSSYQLHINGILVPTEENLPCLCEDSNFISIYVPVCGVYDNRAFFTVVTNNRKQTFTTKRRFSSFVKLDYHLKSCLWRSSLLSDLPQLPKKSINLFKMINSQKFLEERRLQLEIYLQTLVRMPRIQRNPDLLEFLGLAGPEATDKHYFKDSGI